MMMRSEDARAGLAEEWRRQQLHGCAPAKLCINYTNVESLCIGVHCGIQVPSGPRKHIP